MKKKVDVIKKQKFAPFPDPNGVSCEEYEK